MESDINESISVNICGYLQAELGVGEVGRILARGADHAKINYSTLTSTRTINRQNFGFEERSSGESSLINLIAVNADQMKIWAQDVGPEVVEGRYNIGVWSWELEDFPEIFDDAFDFVDEVWAISEFTKSAIQKRTNKPVFAIPLHVESPSSADIKNLDRVPIGLDPNDQYFLFMFDLLSDLDRKNPLGLIEAFKSAFSPDTGPKLFMKSINGGVRSEDLETIRRATDNRADIIIFDGYLDKSQRTALIAECLSYVSLHRSEGYGLTMAEAMSLSKPVIATAYSANCEFMSNDDGLLIPFELVSTKGNPTYPYDSYWAAPSTDMAAEAMRKVFADKVFAQDMGRKALIAQEQRASVQHTSEFMLSRITAITSQLELPEQKELAVPRGSLSKLTSGRAMAEVDLRTLVNASDALAHSPVDLNAVKSSNFLVQLGRKFMARISAPFEQHERLRHQSHVAVSSGLVDELNHFATKSMNKYSEFENQLDSLTNVLRAHKAIAEDLGKRLDQVNLKADQIRSQLRALPYLKDPKIFDLQRGSGWTIGFDNRVAESTPHHLVNVFRPSESELISSLRQYAKFLPANGQGIDLGCGRGEMLHVMRECGLSPFGVDSDQACIDQCLKAGFRAKNTDISSFLRNESAESSEVLTAIHVIEHVVYEDLLQWLRDAYRILKSDGVLILETPNPHAVDALKAFWVDPTHVRPYYPESLLIALQEVGFSRAHVEVQGNQIKAQDRLEFAGSYSIIAQK